MAISVPEGLGPELYPLAWLVGAWQGEGSIGYGPIPPGRITQELSFRVTEGPYLAYQARTWLVLPSSGSAELPASGTATASDAATELSTVTGPAPLTPSEFAASDAVTAPDVNQASRQLWHQESGFWRVTPGQENQDPPFELEVLISDPAGYLALYLGQVNGPRIDLATDALVRTASALELNAATRMYGLVQGDLLWAWDIAGMGQELGSYMALRLQRVEEP